MRVRRVHAREARAAHVTTGRGGWRTEWGGRGTRRAACAHSTTVAGMRHASHGTTRGARRAAGVPRRVRWRRPARRSSGAPSRTHSARPRRHGRR
eukprot:561126-Prymnesium_polylepis.1